MADSVTLGRTDGGLVRLITPIGDASDGGVAAADARLRRLPRGERRRDPALHPREGAMTGRGGREPDRRGPVVSILVVSYNTRAMTLDCLASVVAETTVPHELIVLDNASPDGSAAAIAAAFPGHPADRQPGEPRLRPGQQRRRPRGAGRVHPAPQPRHAGARPGDRPLVAFAGRTPQAGIWGGRTLHGDRTLNPGSVFGRLTLWSLFCRASRPRAGLPEERLLQPRGDRRLGPRRRARRRRGAGQLLPDPPRRSGSALGGFDLAFVMYGEEQDLCRRATRPRRPAADDARRRRSSTSTAPRRGGPPARS